MLRRPEKVYPQPLDCRRRKGTAMGVVARSFVVAAAIRLTRLPVDVLACDPKRFNVHAVQKGGKTVAAGVIEPQQGSCFGGAPAADCRH